MTNKVGFEENRIYEFFNEFGGFVENGKEYEIFLDGNNRPPAPWINVIANKNFGFHVSETGAGYTWGYNSRENKITPWSNDPVSDQATEAIYIKDDVTGDLMTPTSLGQSDKGTYIVRHGFGYSRFFHRENEIKQELTVFTPLDEPVKIWNLNLENISSQAKYLTLTYYVEWALGAQREQTHPYVVTNYNNEYEYLNAKSIYNYHFHKHLAFMFSSEMIKSYSGDRREFLGRKGSVLKPEMIDGPLSCNTGAAYDPCGVIQVSIALQPGEKKDVVFALGQSPEVEEINACVEKYNNTNFVKDELNRVHDYWNKILGTIQVKTNDRAIDILVNGWLLYQTISCRINARAAFYQCGGAYGYRDQLQDTLSLLYTNPDALRNQIKIAASRQFEEGDVQHWWHPPMGMGVRTRISDDLHWLPYAVAHYINGTEDYSILEEVIPYIRGPKLLEHEKEIMCTPEISEMKDTVYEHCKKVIDHAEFGAHGLPLMGGGDWNDGMNEVGIEGKGESVWLAWFIFTMMTNFIPICKYKKDEEYADKLEKKRKELQKNIEKSCWDGEWYLRAFYDDGTKIGSRVSDECRMDSISQSWSVISKAADKERAMKAMQSAWRTLVRGEDGISLLLYPPFDKTVKNPGYIKNYYPGIRENGGQYTHAACWLAIASAMVEDYSMAYTLFTMLNPIHTTANKRNAIKYEKEPYVMIADISLSAPYTGRGGWSWYTGSGGWMYQGLVHHFLGLKKENGYLILSPKTPQTFGDFVIAYKDGKTEYEIKVESRSKGKLETSSMLVDGEKIEGNRIKLFQDEKKHEIII